jgi:hypothetical protein
MDLVWFTRGKSTEQMPIELPRTRTVIASPELHFIDTSDAGWNLHDKAKKEEMNYVGSVHTYQAEQVGNKKPFCPFRNL